MDLFLHALLRKVDCNDVASLEERSHKRGLQLQQILRVKAGPPFCFALHVSRDSLSLSSS